MIKPFSVSEPEPNEAHMQKISSSLHQKGYQNNEKLWKDRRKQKQGMLSTFHNSSEAK